MLNELRFFTSHLRCLFQKLIHVLDFLFLNVNLDSAKQINRIRQRFKVNCYIILNIQIQIFIQHIDSILRTACKICIVGLFDFSIHLLRQRITIDRHHLYFLRLIINCCYNDAVRTCSLFQLSFSGISSKQRNRCISFLICSLIHFDVSLIK